MQATFHMTARRFTRQLRFGLVGVSGIVINSIILWVLVHGFRIAVPVASMIATEAAIGSNFLLNDRWTFAASAAPRSLGQRFLRYNGVALGGMAITAAILTLLTHYTQLNLLIANGGAVGAATIWNYVVNIRWTWSVASRQAPVASRQESVGNGELLLPAACLLLPDRDEEVVL
jgi:dolichol-phosphate mannosyltransferase